ncbi:MAG: CHAT domain-containing protein, partial [Acidobacteriota bacterium]
ILSEMGLSTKARKAWEDYLQRDASSEWASEARKRLESLEKAKAVSHVPDQILSDFWAAYDTQDNEKAWNIVGETKELISGSLVFFQLERRYVNAGTAEEASRNLDGMRFVAELETARTPDKYFPELYKYYRDLGRENKDRVARAAERSDAAYKVMLAGNNWTEVSSAFAEVRSIYTEAGNTWEADLATFQICYSLTQQRQIEESSKCLTSLADSGRSKNHYWVASLADGWLASNRSLSGDYSASIGFNDRSLKNAKLDGDSLGVQKAVSQLVSQYTKLGNEERVLQLIDQASLFSPRYFQSSRQLSRNHLFISQALHRFGYFAGAEAFADEHLTVASDVLKDAWLTHSAHLNKASVLSKLGRVDEALVAADRASQISRTFTDLVMSKRLGFQAMLLRADIYREAGRCSDGLSDYDRVVADNPSTEFVTSLYRARRGRLECLAALGRGTEFVNEMETVIGLFENSRRIIEDESDRHIFFHGEQSVYDLGTEYAFSKLNDPLMAFSYSERSRANSLLEQIPGQTPGTDLASLQRAVPEGVSILYFAVLSERTLIWAVSKDEWEVRSIPISGQDLDELVDAFSSSILRKAYSKQSAESLYLLLLGPLSGAIEGKRLLCIIPDKSLAMLPFAALRQPGGEKFLIEQVALTYSPGSRVLSKLSDDHV